MARVKAGNSAAGQALLLLLMMSITAGSLAADEEYGGDITAEDEIGLEEIVVSGYRQSNALDTNVSLSQFDAATLQRASIAHFEELVPLVPNLNFSGEGSRARYFQVRGIGEREQYEGAPNPSVGFFIDDIDLSGIGGVGSLFDISHAEVLRGPQSARYGANALAGVVYLRSADPQPESGGRGELILGGDGLWSMAAAGGGSLGDTVQARLSVTRLEQDGFRRNTYLGRADTNGRDELTLRAKLNWDLPGDWEALLTGLWLDFDNGYDAWTVRNDDVVHSDHPGEDAQQTSAASLRVQGPVGDRAELVSITSLSDSDIRFSFDGDWGNPDFWREYGEYIYDYRYLNPRQRDTLNQEFRLLSSPQGRLFGDSTDWVIGAFLQRLEEDNQISSTGIYDDSGAENFCAPCLTDRQIDSNYEADTVAVFGSLDADLGKRWDVSAGLRWERWSARYRDEWADINYPEVPPGGDSCSQFDCRPQDNLWGGHLGLGYHLADDIRGYARIARGFKSGGFNPSLAALQGVAVLGPELIAYQPETLWNYELGLKALWPDVGLSAEAALFLMERDNAQLSQSSQQVEFDPNSFVFVTYNGKARSNGLEASLAWQATDSLDLSASVGLLDSEIRATRSTAQVSPGSIGRALAHAPEWTVNLAANWQNQQGWFARLDLAASDAFYFDISHNQRSEPYTLVNIRLGREWRQWALSVWGRNITDENYATRGFFFGNEPPVFDNSLYTKFGDPRQWGITLSYRYGAQ